MLLYYIPFNRYTPISQVEDTIHIPDITESITINVETICWILGSIAVLLCIYMAIATITKIFADENATIRHYREKQAACPIPESIGWMHAGLFTADDVFAAVLLNHIHPGITIKRKNTEPPNGDIFVFNTGTGRYGQNAFQLLWRDYASKLSMSKFVVDYITEHLVKPLSEKDNVIAPLVTIYANDFSDDHSETEEMQKQNYTWEFNDAFSFAEEIFDRMICHAKLLEEKENLK